MPLCIGTASSFLFRSVPRQSSVHILTDLYRHISETPGQCFQAPLLCTIHPCAFPCTSPHLRSRTRESLLLFLPPEPEKPQPLSAFPFLSMLTLLFWIRKKQKPLSTPFLLRLSFLLFSQMMNSFLFEHAFSLFRNLLLPIPQPR